MRQNLRKLHDVCDRFLRFDRENAPLAPQDSWVFGRGGTPCCRGGVLLFHSGGVGGSGRPASKQESVQLAGPDGSENSVVDGQPRIRSEVGTRVAVILFERFGR